MAAVKPEMIPLVWVTVEPMIQAAVDHSHGELSTEVILQRLLDQEMLLLTVCEGSKIMASVTVEKREFQTGKNILNVTTAGGSDLHIWMKFLDEVLDNLARDYGCEEVVIVGRAGWERMLKNIGYGKLHTVMSRKVGE